MRARADPYGTPELMSINELEAWEGNGGIAQELPKMELKAKVTTKNSASSDEEMGTVATKRTNVGKEEEVKFFDTLIRVYRCHKESGGLEMERSLHLALMKVLVANW